MRLSLRSVLSFGLVLSLVAMVSVPAAVSAERPDHPECWGVVTAQRASTDGGIGEHASEQENPRLGLGNVARSLLGDRAHVSDLGTFLAEADALAATACPE